MNAAGLSKNAEIREPVVARALYSPPDAPQGPLLLTNITRETVDATWQAPRYDGGSPLLSYYVEKRDLRENIWIKVARIDAEQTSLKIINVVEAHKYEIRVSAENEYGKSEPLTSEPIKPLRIFGELRCWLICCCFFWVMLWKGLSKLHYVLGTGQGRSFIDKI